MAALKKAEAENRAKQAKTLALKSNQDAAAKGDMFGLLRMGERYRDGDGVEKDLAKARDYLQKAADAGSPTAKDELSKLEAK
jgi:TPR repeat protein